MTSDAPAVPATAGVAWLDADGEQAGGHFHGIVQTADGDIWIQCAHEDTTRSCLLRCDSDGRVRQRLRPAFLAFPHGLERYRHPRHGECLVHTDCETGVALTTLAGELLWQLARPDFYRLAWTLAWKPTNCAIAADGRIYLADGYGTGFVVVLDPDGRELGLFGGPSPGPEGLVHPHGLGIVHRQGRELVAVGESHLSSQDPELLARFGTRSCLKLFDLDGALVDRVALDTLNPRHLRPLPGGGHLVPDFQGRLLVLDGDLRLVRSLGRVDDRFARPCDVARSLARPHDACVLADGRLLVTDYTGRVESFAGGLDSWWRVPSA